MLEAIDLSKAYEEGVLALDRLNLRVEPGHIYCLLGANGAGKTTTINLFLDLVRPSSGRVLVDGIDVAKEPQAAQKRLAYIPENVALYGALTARQNLAFFADLFGKSRLGKEELDRALGEAGLPESAYRRRVREFSKGMRQKVGIAIALLKDAPALLLDEPMSGLDPDASAQFVDVLKTIRDKGKAVLMSTHDVFRAKELADRVGIMYAGRKVAEYTRDELVGKDLERLYLDCIRGQGVAPPHPAEQAV